MNSKIARFAVIASVLLLSSLAQAQNDKDKIFEEAMAARGIIAKPVMKYNPVTRLVLKGYEFSFADGSSNPKGEIAVCQHGWTSNPASMVFVVENLLKQGFQPRAYSWPGHGWGTENALVGLGNRSYFANARKGDYSPDKMVETAKFIAEFTLKESPTGTFISVGHSMGAMVTSAANAMGLYPARRLILIGGPPHFEYASKLFYPYIASDRIRRMLPLLSSNQPLQYLVGKIEDGDKPMNFVRRAALRQTALKNPALALGVSPVYDETFKWFMDQYLVNYRWKGLHLRSPALFLYGDIENLTQISQIAEDAVERGSRAGYWVGEITVADHLLQIMNERSVNVSFQLVNKFLTEFETSRSGETYQAQTLRGTLKLLKNGTGIEGNHDDYIYNGDHPLLVCKKALL